MKKETHNALKIQDYLSFGYLYLILMGILKDSFIYGLLGINILNYSNVMDVLLSPIVYLVEKPIALLVLIILSLLIIRFIKPKVDKSKEEEVKKKVKTVQPFFMNGQIFMIIIILFGFYCGSAISMGFKYKNRLEKQEFVMEDQVILRDNKELKVKIVGQNSAYLFLAKKGEEQLTILPIEGNVASIKLNAFKEKEE